MPIYNVAGALWDSDYPFPDLSEHHGQAGEVFRLVAAPDGAPRPEPTEPAGGRLIEDDAVWAESFRLGADYLLRWQDIDFVVDAEATTITCYTESGQSANAVWILFEDWAVPFLLMLRGRIVFHAGCVAPGRAAIAFAGMSGRGKTTITTMLARAGAEWFADDLTTVHESGDQHWVVASHPLIGLHPDAAEHFEVGEVGDLKAVVRLEATQIEPSEQTAPLSAFFELHRHEDGGVLEIKDLGIARRVQTLLSHIRTTGLALPDQRAEIFKFCERLAARVRVAQLHYPVGLEHLPAIRDCIFQLSQKDAA